MSGESSEYDIHDFTSFFPSSFDRLAISYNSLNRYAALSLCRSLKLKVTKSQLDSMSLFLAHLVDVTTLSSDKYYSLLHDPLFKAQIVLEESLILKLHISLVERLSSSSIAKLRHFWLSSLYPSSPLSSSLSEFDHKTTYLFGNLFDVFSTNPNICRSIL